MKIIVLVLSVLFGLQSFAQNSQTKPLRYFLQGEPSSSKAIQYGNNAIAGNYANAGDARIYYEIYGKGKPFVVLHGGGYGSIYEMHQLIDSLSKNYQVIAISTRGHGKSEIGKDPVTYEQRANDVMSVINKVTKDKVNILGFSDGAYTSYKIASMYPERVEKVIAIGAGEQVPGLRKLILDIKEASNYDKLYYDQQLALMSQPNRLQEYWTNMASFYNTMIASKELFATIKCPVLVVAGEGDMNAPLATIFAAYQMMPNSQLSIIPKAPHPVFLVNFAAVWASMGPFLKEK